MRKTHSLYKKISPYSDDTEIWKFIRTSDGNIGNMPIVSVLSSFLLFSDQLNAARMLVVIEINISKFLPCLDKFRIPLETLLIIKNAGHFATVKQKMKIHLTA